MFPGSVDRLILDSNMNPKTIGVGGGLLAAAAQNEAFRARLSQYFEWAAANDDKVKLGSTPLQVFEKWNAARLSASPKAYAANYLPPAAIAEDLPENLRPFAAVILPAYNTARQVYERIAYNVRVTVGLMSGALSPTDVITATRGPSNIMLNSTSKMYNRAQWTGLSQQIYGMTVEGKPDSAFPGTSAAIGAGNGTVTIYDRMGPAVVDASAKAAQTGKIDVSYLPAALISAGGLLFNVVTGADTASSLSAFMRTMGNVMAFAGSNRAPDYSVNLATSPLLLQSYGDPATPYSGVAAMRDAVRGMLISVGGGDHGLFRRGEATVDNAVKQYLADGTVSVTTAPEAALGPDGKYITPSVRPTATTSAPQPVAVAAAATSSAGAASAASTTAPETAASGTAAPVTSASAASTPSSSAGSSGAPSSGTASATWASTSGTTESSPSAGANAAAAPTVTEPASSKTEASKSEASKAEASKAEASKAEASKAETATASAGDQSTSGTSSSTADEARSATED
ncbi:TAP domain protein OS=Tsukamurella paurometabola (strain ATCC 8368 / DSM / CCUG 35730 / CIP 100753 / JCM 10117 / KCTC 9821 / NBRC 16120 / NCIMB 702349 /NCTC 13040) OX=521096 GN=Tpau_1136 PE=4 SV=1 [Tsukamurella paurometabola]|uniref:TAP domain protein n=1 Tax=Tsukamurella paurometabola (strain ATCC 8368 / DSM 20162 / CCUG 35730 / CIP 100753 / JCM 10117 / KCTC 9821 / NBRC 16120 / NCIMB 702349 / NCTC 13040) TaxID=521096 RepID=D5UVW0_TSUPD|nr:alpha/beta hydrolase [Tsukamurella paurometabola]ADG77767.1 TAP domain protein [Tsukamurella paurometabola DSM 20162]SUP28679.1 Ribonucleases G and E [Tsukamurella paurometabola]